MKTNDPRADLTQAVVISWAAVSTKVQDKYSIEDQLKLERDWCKKHGAVLIDELVVRGFSRDYWTLADVVAAAEHDPDMLAFAQLQQHIRKQDFNVFLCFDADRFGRTESLILEVLGRVTRDCQALVYTLFDGIWMDEESAPMIGLLKAHKAQADVTKLKSYRATGMDNRARDGKSTSAIMPLFHRRVRDEKGIEIDVVVNEDLRALWTDLATLILRGVEWYNIEDCLFGEFGHGVNGKPYRPYYMHSLITSPAWWGHAALNYREREGRSTKGVAPWIWDEAVDPPVGVTVYRNRLPAVYSGEWIELGERIKEQLWNWHKLRGKATHRNAYRFHGLLVCDVCGDSLVKVADKQRIYMRCPTYFDKRRQKLGRTCDQRGHLRAPDIQDYFHQKLDSKLRGLPSTLFDDTEDNTPVLARIEAEKQRVKRLKARISTFADELADAPEYGRETFRLKIAAASDEITQSLALQKTLETQAAQRAEQRASQEYWLQVIQDSGGLEWFWGQPDTFIHQVLSGILGNRQLTVRDRLITGSFPISNKAMLSRRKRGN